MLGQVEYGTCDICKTKDVHVSRKYYRYNIKCECHSPHHFEIVWHCSNCTPIEPRVTKITVMTNELKNKVGELNE